MVVRDHRRGKLGLLPRLAVVWATLALGVGFGWARPAAPVHEAPPAAAEAEAEADAPVEPEAPPPAPQIQIVIVGPGTSDYTLYGHAGVVVVRDPAAPIEQAELYNFGITNFRRPGYVIDFLGGRVRFWGHRRPYGRYLARWIKADRTVARYPVALAPQAARAMIARLARDVSPEHRRYIYDTFRENCATRIRDLLDAYTGGAVWSHLGEVPGGRSFRDDVRAAYANRPALLLMTEVVPGPSLDAPRSRWALAYRPEALAEGLTDVRIEGRPLLGPPVIDHRRAGPDPRAGNPNRARGFLGIAATIVFLIALVVAGVPARARGLLLLVGAVSSTALGALLLWVGTTTAWPDMQGSWLVFWFTPLDVGLFWTAFRLIVKRRAAGRWARGYLLVRVALVAGLTVASPFVGALAGPLAPRLLGLAGLLAALRCVGVGPSADRVLRRILRRPLGKAT